MKKLITPKGMTRDKCLQLQVELLVWMATTIDCEEAMVILKDYGFKIKEAK